MVWDLLTFSLKNPGCNETQKKIYLPNTPKIYGKKFASVWGYFRGLEKIENTLWDYPTFAVHGQVQSGFQALDSYFSHSQGN